MGSRLSKRRPGTKQKRGRRQSLIPARRSQSPSGADGGPTADEDTQVSLPAFGEDGESIEWLEKWRDTRDGAMKKIGLDLSASYDVLGLAAFGGDDVDTGFGGDLTVNGRWHFGGEKWDVPFELNFRMRHRHAFGDTAPSGVASQTGALWGLVDGFSDKGFEIPDFYLIQKFLRENMFILLMLT